jgi:hypothetical protein
MSISKVSKRSRQRDKTPQVLRGSESKRKARASGISKELKAALPKVQRAQRHQQYSEEIVNLIHRCEHYIKAAVELEGGCKVGEKILTDIATYNKLVKGEQT